MNFTIAQAFIYGGQSVSNVIGVLMVICLSLLYIALLLGTLFDLRKGELDNVSKVLWAYMILLIPIFGAITFMIVGPKGKS